MPGAFAALCSVEIAEWRMVNIRRAALIAIPRNQNRKVAVLLQPRHASLVSINRLNSHSATVIRKQENHITALGARGSRPEVDKPCAWGEEYVAAISRRPTSCRLLARTAEKMHTPSGIRRSPPG